MKYVRHTLPWGAIEDDPTAPGAQGPLAPKGVRFTLIERSKDGKTALVDVREDDVGKCAAAGLAPAVTRRLVRAQRPAKDGKARDNFAVAVQTVEVVVEPDASADAGPTP